MIFQSFMITTALLPPNSQLKEAIGRPKFYQTVSRRKKKNLHRKWQNHTVHDGKIVNGRKSKMPTIHRPQLWLIT